MLATIMAPLAMTARGPAVAGTAERQLSQGGPRSDLSARLALSAQPT